VTHRQSNSGACRAKTGNDASHLLGDKYREEGSRVVSGRGQRVGVDQTKYHVQ
jgi:hypothetical protein